MANLANIFVTMLTTYYTYHIFNMLFNRKNRKNIQDTNVKLDDLRSKPKKSLKEQKEFLELKHPKRIGTFKWRWNLIPKFLLTLAVYIVIFRIYYSLLTRFNIEFALWQAILYVILFPLIINLVLEKFKVQKGDISVFFRKHKRK